MGGIEGVGSLRFPRIRIRSQVSPRILSELELLPHGILMVTGLFSKSGLDFKAYFEDLTSQPTYWA